MPFVNKKLCKKCIKYSKEYSDKYWVKCDMTCTEHERLMEVENGIKQNRSSSRKRKL